MGQARSELSLGLCSFPSGRDVIFYEPVQEGIDVVLVLHAARDIDIGFAG